MDVSDTSDYSGSNFSSLSHTIFNEDVFDVKTQLQILNCTSKDDPGYKNDLDNLEKVIELKFYKKFDKLMRLNVQLESQLLAANKFINSLQNDTILDSELKKLNFDLNFKINELECELKALKCSIENNEKMLDSLRCENEEKSVLLDMKSNSIVSLKNKIVELHLQLLESKQTNLKSDHAITVLTNELNAIKKSEDWYKKSLSEYRLQKGALTEELTNLQLQLIAKNRDLQLQILKNLDQKQMNYQIKENCNCQKVIYTQNQAFTPENSLLQSNLNENDVLIGNIQKLNEEFVSNHSSCTYPTPEVSFGETDLHQVVSVLFMPDDEQNSQITLKQSSSVMNQEKANEQDLVQKNSDLDAEIQELKNCNEYSKSLLMVEIQKHEETVAELGIQYMALQNEVGYLKDSNFKYFSELENLQITYQEVQEANKMNENQAKTMRLENQDLKLEKLCYQTQVQNLRTENENLIRKHTSETEGLKENLDTIKCFSVDIETENNELKKTNNIEKQRNEETIAELGIQFDHFQNQIENLQCANDEYQVAISSFGKEIEELKSYVDTSDQLLVNFKTEEEMAKQDLCGQILTLNNKIEECQNKHNSEIISKNELMKELKEEKEINMELQEEVFDLQNKIKKCNCDSEVIILQNKIEELKNEIEIKENLIICSKEENKKIKEVEMKLILEVQNLENLIHNLKSEADFKDERRYSAEESQDRLARQLLDLQNEILKMEEMKEMQIKNIQKTSVELAQSNDSILSLVTTLNMESDAEIKKLKNENFDLRCNFEIEAENLREIIRELEDHANVNLSRSSFESQNILFEPTVMDFAEREENIILKAEVKRLSTLYKAKEMQNEENRERCEKSNRSLLNEITEYKRRCAKMQKMYKQISEEFNSYKFSNISKNQQIECSCDNYKNLLPNFNTNDEELKQSGATEIFVQNEKALHNDEKITPNGPTSKIALQKTIDNLQEEIDFLQADLITTKRDKYFLQRLCKDLKFSLESYTSQTKMLKKQNDILKSLDCGKFSELLSTMPSPNKCDDTFIKELIKSSCQYQNPVGTLESSVGLFKEEVVRLQKFVL